MDALKRLRRLFWIAAGLGILGLPGSAQALTFQFDRTQPGVQDFVHAYIRYSAGGRELSAVLPSTFYIVSTRSENDTVVIAKTGDPKKNPALNTFLKALAGKSPAKIQGPHGGTLWYNPSPPEKRLSAYTQWGEWLFVARNRNALAALLKPYAFPQAVVTPGGEFAADGRESGGGIRFWGANTGGDLTALMKESQKKILIPLIQDPSQIRRISGMLRLEGGRRLSGTLTFIPSGSSRDGLRKDLKFINESIRRKLSALKVVHQGEILEEKSGLTFKISVEDYAKAQPGLIRIQP